MNVVSANLVKIVGKVIYKSDVLTFNSGDRITLRIHANNKSYLVQAWDKNCYFIRDNISNGDYIYVSGELKAYEDSVTKSTNWCIKVKDVEKYAVDISMSGVVTNTKCARAGKKPKNCIAISLKPEIKDSNIVYCFVPKRYEKNLYVGRKINVKGSLDFEITNSQYSRITILVNELLLLS